MLVQQGGPPELDLIFEKRIQDSKNAPAAIRWESLAPPTIAKGGRLGSSLGRMLHHRRLGGAKGSFERQAPPPAQLLLRMLTAASSCLWRLSI